MENIIKIWIYIRYEHNSDNNLNIIKTLQTLHHVNTYLHLQRFSVISHPIIFIWWMWTSGSVTDI